MTPQAWCVRLAFAACAGAVTACSFDRADVVTDAPDDGGTFDVAPGGEAEAGVDDSAAPGGPDAATADAPPNGDGGGTDAPADSAPDTVQPDTGNAGTRVTNGIVVLYTF